MQSLGILDLQTLSQNKKLFPEVFIMEELLIKISHCHFSIPGLLELLPWYPSVPQFFPH